MATLISASLGLTVALFVWQLWFVFTDIPDENRAWRDRPALGFRMVWWLIKFFEFYVSRWYSDDRHANTKLRLVEAGLEYSLSSGQFIAARWVSAIVAVVICSVALQVFKLPTSWFGLLVAPWGYVYPDLWVKRVIEKRRRTMDRDLPFYLDVVTLSVEAGTNLTGALTQAVSKANESPLRQEFNRVLRDVRAGKTRADALREMSVRAGNQSLASIISGMIQAERSGASLGPVLRAQSTQLRNTRFAQAEKRAMEAPVKLLAPLVIFIFPTTFIVLLFLVLSKMLQQDMVSWAPVVWAYSWPG